MILRTERSVVTLYRARKGKILVGLSENEGLLITCSLDITLQWLIQQAKNQKS